MTEALDDIKREVDRLEPLHKQLKDEAIFILESGLNEANIKFHSIGGRIKKLGSILNKMERKQVRTLSDLTDLVGVRIVCLFLSDIKKVGEVIRYKFDVVSEDNKIEDNETESFGYMSHHFIVRMKKGYAGPRYDPIRDFSVEIQVRTIAMDAWAATSHYLDYKSEQDVPKELRKDFFALSGLFYVADQHFEMFFRARLDSKKTIEHELNQSPSGVNVELNLDTLQEYLKRQFPDRQRSHVKGVSELVRELRSCGYDSIDKIDQVMKRGLNVALKYEREHPPGSTAKKPPKTKVRYNDVGITRMLFDIVNPEFAAKRAGGGGFAVGEYRHLVE